MICFKGSNLRLKSTEVQIEPFRAENLGTLQNTSIRRGY